MLRIGSMRLLRGAFKQRFEFVVHGGSTLGCFLLERMGNVVRAVGGFRRIVSATPTRQMEGLERGVNGFTQVQCNGWDARSPSPVA